MQVLTSTIFIKPLPASSVSNLRYFTWLPGFYGDNCFLKVKKGQKRFMIFDSQKGTEGSPGRRQSYIWVESISLQVLGSRKGEKFWKCWLLFGRRKENHPHMSGRVFAHSRPHIVLCSWRRLGRRRWFADLWTSWAKETPIVSDTVCLWNYA